MNSLLSAVLTVFLDVFFSHHEWTPQWWLRHPTLNDRDGGLPLRWKVTYFSPHLDPLPYESCTSRTHRLPRSHHFRVNSHHWHLLTPVARYTPLHRPGCQQVHCGCPESSSQDVAPVSLHGLFLSQSVHPALGSGYVPPLAIALLVA